MILNAMARKPLPVYGDGKNVRDWLYVGDHCAAVRLALATRPPGRDLQHRRQQRKDQPRGRQGGLRDARRAPSRPAPRHAAAHHVSSQDRPGHDRRYAIDARKIECELGWKPRERFDTGLRKTVEWYLDNMKWVDSVTSGEYRSWIEPTTRSGRNA